MRCATVKIEPEGVSREAVFLCGQAQAKNTGASPVSGYEHQIFVLVLNGRVTFVRLNKSDRLSVE